MNELLKKDFNIKIISVLFAVFLWFLVLDSSANPFDTKTFSIPLKVQNEVSLQEKGLGIKNRDFTTNVDIVVKGRRDKLSGLSSYDFEAIVDFAKIKDSGVKDIPIEIRTNKEGISFETKRPHGVSVTVEKIVKSSFKVEIVPNGKLKDNYKILKAVAVPETVEIEGIESLVKSVAGVKGEIKVSGLSRVPSIIRADCKIVNKNGDEITALGKNFIVDVAIDVAKEVTVIPVVKGKLAKDFVEKELRVNPGKVLITGLPDIIEKIEALETEAVNIENLNKNIDLISFLKLPDGVRLADAEKEVRVSVSVEQLVSRVFTLAKNEISMVNVDTEGSLKYEVVNENVPVSIKGRQKDLDQVNKNSFKPTIDLARLTEGTHKVPLKVTLPGELKFTEEQFVEVRITKPQPVKENTARQD